MKKVFRVDEKSRFRSLTNNRNAKASYRDEKKGYF
jgi:hypothetical protein